MKWKDFAPRFNDDHLIKLQDIRNLFGEVSSVQLSRWVDEGLLIRLRRGQYILGSQKDLISKEVLANEMKPSYISLEYALNYHNLTPEIPRKITSVTTERGETIATPVGDYIYRHIQPNLFTGYRLVKGRFTGQETRVAEPTKALFDYAYFTKIGGWKEIEELRLNPDSLREDFEEVKFLSWVEKVANPALKARLKGFLGVVR